MKCNHKYQFVIEYPTEFYAREVGIYLNYFGHKPEYAEIDGERNVIIIGISKYFDMICRLLVSAKKNKILKADKESLMWLDKYMEQDDYYDTYIEDRMNAIVVGDLAEAWKALDAELIIRHLAPEFKFKSMWMHESLDRDRYTRYIRDQFDEIRQSGAQWDIREVPEHDALAISKNGNEPAYYIAEIRNGAIVKVDWTKFLK